MAAMERQRTPARHVMVSLAGASVEKRSFVFLWREKQSIVWRSKSENENVRKHKNSAFMLFHVMHEAVCGFTLFLRLLHV